MADFEGASAQKGLTCAANCLPEYTVKRLPYSHLTASFRSMVHWAGLACRNTSQFLSLTTADEQQTCAPFSLPERGSQIRPHSELQQDYVGTLTLTAATHQSDAEPNGKLNRERE